MSWQKGRENQQCSLLSVSQVRSINPLTAHNGPFLPLKQPTGLLGQTAALWAFALFRCPLNGPSVPSSRKQHHAHLPSSEIISVCMPDILTSSYVTLFPLSLRSAHSLETRPINWICFFFIVCFVNSRD